MMPSNQFWRALWLTGGKSNNSTLIPFPDMMSGTTHPQIPSYPQKFPIHIQTIPFSCKYRVLHVLVAVGYSIRLLLRHDPLCRKEYLSEMSLAKLESSLDSKRFVRVHRNSIVNTYSVTSLSRSGEDEATLKNGMRIAVSRRDRPRLVEVLDKYSECVFCRKNSFLKNSLS